MTDTRPEGWGARPEPATQAEKDEYAALQEAEGIDPNADADDEPRPRPLPGARAWGFL